MFDAQHVAGAVLMSAGFLNDDSIQNDTDCAETTEGLVADHWLLGMCGRVYHVEPAKSYNWDFVIEKQSNNNRIWLWNKQPKTLFISVRGGKLKPFFPPSSMFANRCCKLWPASSRLPTTEPAAISLPEWIKSFPEDTTVTLLLF